MHPLLANLANDLWAMEPVALERFFAVLAEGDWASAARLEASAPASILTRNGSEATIAIAGPLLPSVPAIFRAFGIDATGYDEITAAAMEAMRDPSVSSVRFAVDSPGGAVSGVHGAADALAALSKVKPTVADVGGMAASAGYWLASQARQITADRGSQVGSIGVYSVVRDFSRAAENAGVKVHVIASSHLKGAGAPGAPVTDAQLADMRRTIDEMAAQFVSDVATGRGKDSAAILEHATGQVWSAQESLSRGLIDRINPTLSERITMDAFALIEKHPAHAKLIASMAKDGQSADAISAAIASADAAAALAAAHADAESAKAEAAAAREAAAAAAEKLAAVTAELAEAKTKIDALGAIADGGKAGAKVQPDAGESKPALSATDAQFIAMTPTERMEFRAKGGKLI